MEIMVKYFGLESIQEGFEVILPEGATGKDLLEKLKKESTDEEKILLDTATIMINEDKGYPGTVLKDRDRVLILIPLGGG
jgi:molybdopterin converting factor small subunit